MKKRRSVLTVMVLNLAILYIIDDWLASFMFQNITLNIKCCRFQLIFRMTRVRNEEFNKNVIGSIIERSRVVLFITLIRRIDISI